jgi:lysophospholipase L1-like esterase
MATVALTTTPIQIDDGTSYTVLVTNTGAVEVDLSRGGRLRPQQSRTVYPEGTALTAAATSGTGTVTTSTTSKPLPNAADPAALAANAAFTGTYAGLSVTGQQALETQRNTALRTWLAAMADRENNPANIVFLGDSLAEGRAASTPDTGWAAKATGLLRSRFPVAGLASQPARNYIPAWYGWSTFNSSKEFSAANANVVQQSSCGLGLRNYRLSTNASGTCTVTVTGSAVDVVWVGSTGTGTFSWAVDGGSATNVPNNGAASLTDGLKTRITFGSVGTHTITLTWVSGGNVFLDGVIVYNGDEAKGIRGFDAGHSGLKISDYTVTSNPAFETSVAAVSPHLVAISLGENDWVADVPASTAQANLQALIARVKTASTTSPSFVLMAWPTPLASGTTHTDTWANYLAMYAAVAAADPANVCVLDMTQRATAPGVSNALGLFNSDLQHPSTKGSTYIADTFVSFVSPR